MQKFQIELDDAQYGLLEAMAKDDYRDPRQQAAWLVACAVSGWATWRRNAETLTTADSAEEEVR